MPDSPDVPGVVAALQAANGQLRAENEELRAENAELPRVFRTAFEIAARDAVPAGK